MEKRNPKSIWWEARLKEQYPTLADAQKQAPSIIWNMEKIVLPSLGICYRAHMADGAIDAKEHAARIARAIMLSEEIVKLVKEAM